MQQVGKYILVFGLILVVAGLVFWLLGDKLGFLGRLPGDIRIKRENFSFYFPITTMLLISGLLNLIIWIVRKLSS